MTVKLKRLTLWDCQFAVASTDPFNMCAIADGVKVWTALLTDVVVSVGPAIKVDIHFTVIKHAL